MGQGLAGTLLTLFLRRAGKSVRVIDNRHRGAASMVAAGIINPVTGRRFVKTWRADELIPTAVETYRSLEAELGITFFHERNIIRSIFNPGEENDWSARAQDEAYSKYILEKADTAFLKNKTNPVFGYGEVTNSYQTEIGKMLKAFRRQLEAEGTLTEEEFDFKNLKIEDSQASYKEFKANKIVFCEGAAARQNPYFSYLPFGGSKGEVLIARIPNADFEKLYKYRIFLVPLSEKDTYWVGSMYAWQFEDDQPTEAGRTYLINRLQDVLTIPWEIIEHKAAVRPTVKDRRPFLGIHPEFKSLAIFNGLGTKGASLGPFFAKQMAMHLLKNTKIDPEVNIERYAATGV